MSASLPSERELYRALFGFVLFVDEAYFRVVRLYHSRPLRERGSAALDVTGIDDLEFPWGRDYYETPPYSGNKVARYYVARTRREQIELPVDPDLGRPEHHEYRWVDFGEALSLTVPRIQSVVTWAAGKVASEYKIA